MNSSSITKLAVYTFFFFFSIYLFTAPGHIMETDGYVRYLGARNIIENQTVIFKDESEVKKMGGWFYKNKRGEFITYYMPGQTILFIPLYWFGKTIGPLLFFLEPIVVIEFFCSLLNQILMAGLCVLIMLICLSIGYSKKISFIVSAIFGLATYAWPLSRGVTSNVQAAFFIASSALLFLKSLASLKNQAANAFLSGFLLGLAFFTREESVIILPAFLFLYLGVSYKAKEFKLSKTALGGLIFLIGFSIWFLLSTLYFFVSGRNFLTYQRIVEFTNTTPFLNGMFGLLFSPGCGLLFFNPVNWIAVFLVKRFYEKNKLIAAFFFLIVGYWLIFFSKSHNWTGWLSYGPRNIFLIQVCLIIFIGTFFERWKYFPRHIKVISVLLIFLSFIIQIPASAVVYERYFSEMMAVKNISVDKLIWNPLYSPIIGQFKNFFSAISNILHGRKFLWIVDNTNIQMGLDSLISYNIIDWWWIYALYKGIKIALVAPIALLFIMWFSLTKIIRLIKFA